MKKKENFQIAVIGLGCLYPGASGALELWENILARKQQFRQMPDARLPLVEYFDSNPEAPDKTYQSKAAVLENYAFDWIEKKIPKQAFESTDIVHWLTLDVALMALKDAGYTKEKLPRNGTGVIIGNTLTGEFTRSNQMLLRWPYVKKVLKASLKQKGLESHFESLEPIMQKYYKSVFAPITEDSLAGGLANTIAGRVCNFLDIHGGGYIVDGACSSSLLAICTAANYLESGQMDMVIAGGVDISLDTFELIGFAKTGALTRDEMRVYDQNGKGFIPGEGCGIVILKRLEDALKDQDQVYAIINGWGISSDGKGGITAPSSVGQSMALKRAYQKANFNPQNLNFIEGHGTGTTVGDKTEIEGISLALEGCSNGRHCGLTSFKSIVGHTKAAAGVGAFIKTVIALNQRILPPTAGIKTSHNIFSEKAFNLYPLRHGQIKDKNSTLFAGVSAMGFGGINSHILLQSGAIASEKFKPNLPEQALMVSNQSNEVFLMAGETLEELTNNIQKTLKQAEGISYAELSDYASYINKQINFEHKWRASVVAETPVDLQEKLQTLEKNLNAFGGSLQGGSIIWGQSQDNLRIGALFSGQGSQRLNMAYKLLKRFEWAQKLIPPQIEKAIYKFSELAANKEEEQSWKDFLKQTQIAQPAIIFASLVWFKYLQKLGFKFMAATGHSLGELMSFYAAGFYDEKTLLDFAAFRGQVMATEGSGSMLSLACDQERASALMQKTNYYLSIANLNSPTQTILSGEEAGIQEILKLAQAENIHAVQLPVSAAFHSKLIQKAAEQIYNFPFPEHKSQGLIELISALKASKIDHEINLNQYFAEQALGQVNFKDAIKQLNCDFLVEVGPGRILSSLAEANGLECLPVEAEAEDDLSLNLLLALAFVKGVNLNIDQIYYNRLIRPFIPASQKEFIRNPLERPLPEEVNYSTNGDFSMAFDLANNLNIPIDELQGYLEQRKDFLQEIIKADLKHLPKPEFAKALPQIAKTVKLSSDFSPNRIIPIQEFKQEAKEIKQDNSSVSETVYALAATKTGFPPDKIQGDFRLLDDLNLDSIKAGTLLGELARKYGLQGKLEAANYANATLNEIIEKVNSLISVPSLPSEPSLTNNVQNFVVELKAEKLQSPIQKFNNLTLVYADQMPEELKQAFTNQANSVQILHYEQLNENNNLNNLIVLMPEKGLEQTVELLAKVAQITSKQNCNITLIQFGDGRFGRLQKNNLSASFSAVAFAATLHLERSESKICVLEFHKLLAPSLVAENTCQEIQQNSKYTVASYNEHNERYKMIYDFASPQAKPRKNINISSQDLVLVTGGAKGITAECALAFAQKYNCQMALIGSSPANAEVNNTLQKYAKLGLKANYYICDITDEKALNNLIANLGSIKAIIHGAGLNKPRRAEHVNAKQAYEEISPKLIGAINLLKAVPQGDLKYFIALTSIIGITGMQGNSWYAFSNEALDLLLRQQTHLETLTLAYSVWSEIGMGEKMGSTKTLANMGIGSISPDQGIQEFLYWLDNIAPDQQIVITAELGGIDTWPLKKNDILSNASYLEQITEFKPKNSLKALCNLNLQKDQYLLEHNFNDSLLFPTVFGLEAMTEAAAHLLEVSSFENITLENIMLLRPIIVTDQLQIQISAQIIAPNKVLVGISTEDSAFTQNHFSAEISFNTNSLSKIELPQISKPLPLNPQTDLYSWLLFQGESFQNIDQIYNLNSQEILFSVKEANHNNLKRKPFLSYSPFMRDTLLQSAQLILTDAIYLPIKIKKWQISNFHNSNTKTLVQAQKLKVENKSGFFAVKCLDEQGQILEQIEEYEVKALREIPESFNNEELAQGNLIENKIKAKFELVKKFFKHSSEIIAYKHFENFNILQASERRQIEENVLKKYYPQYALNWLENGKPQINGNLDISISHSNSLLIVLLGEGKQGCDLEFVKKYNWADLLNEEIYKALAQVENHDQNLDKAGTRLWCLKEAVIKAFGNLPQKIEIQLIEKENIIFKGEVNQEIFEVLTFPIEIWPNNEIIIGLVISSEPKPIKPESEIEIIPAEINFDELTHKFSHNFNTTFKDCKAFCGKTYFTNFPVWMGHLRELVLKPISQNLLEDFRGNQYGMVTNTSKIKIYNEAEALNEIEGRVWITPKSDFANSFIDLGFEWLKKDNGLKLAEGNLGTTWVIIEGHGIVKQSPIPEYFLNFLENYSSKHQLGFAEHKPHYILPTDLGKSQYQSLPKPRPEILLNQRIYSTGLYNGNSVGNLYYSNYYDWQANSLEYFLYGLIPDIFKGQGKQSEFICLETAVSHLQEAMPFEEITVNMYLEELFEFGFKLYFEYYSGSRKLAYGYNIIAWAKRSSDKALPQINSLPSEIYNCFSNLISSKLKINS